MAYQTQTFTDNETVLTAAMMDHIEAGIVANETSIEDVSTDLASHYVQKNAIAASFDETTPYTKGQYVWYENVLCRFLVDHEPGAFVEEEVEYLPEDGLSGELVDSFYERDEMTRRLTEIQSSDVVSSQTWAQGTYNDSGTAVASTTNLRMYGLSPSNLVVKVDVSGDYKYKIFRFNASDMTLVDKTEWILPDDDPVFISVDKTQKFNVVLSRLDEATIDISEASNVVVHLLYGNEYYSNVAETTGKNLIHYRMFNVKDGGANISFNDETESVIVTAVGNTDYQCAQFYLNELQQICKVGHQYRLSYEAEVLSGTPYILMAVRGANGSPNSRVISAGPGSGAPSGTYGFTFKMNEYMGRIMAQVSETANNPGASVRYYNISLQEIMPDTAVDAVVREKVEETKGNEVALYPDMWFEFGGIDAADGTIYNGNTTYMARNRRTANYVKVDHDGYIYFKNPDASKFNLRIVQYNLDYTMREVQGLTNLETFCFMNSSNVMYKIQISAKDAPLDTEVPTLSDCHVGVYYPVQFISGIGSSEPKNTYCIMTHNIGQWTTGSGTRMITNAPTWINLHDAIIERYSPDVLCLQEYLPYESITGNYYENSYAFNSPNNNVYSGKCILSNMPLENSTGGVYSNQASGSIACNWAKSYVWLGGHKVAIITTHLSTTLETAQLQNAELKALADNEEYVIICGDFNVPCSATTDTNYINVFEPWVDAGYRMANGGQFGFMPTFYASSSVAKEDGLCIDYIITSGNLNVSFACVDYQKYNAAIDTKIDHMPLVAYVSLSSSSAVRYDEVQALTVAQQMHGRGNIQAQHRIEPDGSVELELNDSESAYITGDVGQQIQYSTSEASLVFKHVAFVQGGCDYVLSLTSGQLASANARVQAIVDDSDVIIQRFNATVAENATTETRFTAEADGILCVCVDASTEDNIQLHGGPLYGTVRYNTSQSLTDAQKEQARKNAGAASQDAMAIISRGHGENLIALTDFTEVYGGGTSYTVDTENQTITVTSTSGTYRCLQTPVNWVQNHLTPGHTYRLHAKSLKVSGIPEARVAFRGGANGADIVNYDASIIYPDPNNGGDAFVDYTVDRFTRRITLFVSFGRAYAASVTFSDIWLVDVTDARNLAPVDTTTAAATHDAGDLLTVNGTLYKATQAIATGETITPGTNVASTTVAEQLAERDTAIAAETAAREKEINAIEGSAADALSVKAYGPQFTGTDNGVTITKSGRRVTLNGTKTGGAFRCVSVTNGLVATNNDSPTANHVNQDAVLYAGRTYVIWFRVISGTYSQSSNNCGVWMFTYDGTTPHSPAISSNLLETINGGGYASIRRTFTTDMRVGFGLYFRTGCSFSNLVIEYGVQDITNELPDAPSSDGTYTLKVTVTNGVPAYSWIAT